jgi:uncharacterized protein (TIGR02246 family)
MRQVLYILFCMQLALFSQAALAMGTAQSKMITDPNAQADKLAVQQAYTDWTKAIETAKGNAKVITELYAPDAILLATLSPEVKRNLHSKASYDLINFSNTDLSQYFTEFSKLKDVHVTTQKLYTQLFNDVAINTGLYTFIYVDDKGKTIDVPARFTFVYEKIGDKWLIINHHSSYLPEGKKKK